MLNDAVDLDAPTATDIAVVGRKAATLARLRALGMSCPPGLVLPVGAPPAAVDAFARAAAARWPGPVAVRSSTTWEDHATSAHAGQGHTELGASGTDEVAAAVRACRAATLPDGRAPGEGVAVLVQPLLAPEHAGVAFTADPTTGERDVVRIAATAGLGDRLVGGDAVGSDVIVRGEVVAGDRAGLPGDACLAVAAAAREVDHHLGGPQDVEWALVDGTVHVLQARPISVLPIPPQLPTGNGWQKDVAHHSGLVTPFGWWALTAASGVVAEVFAEAGLIIAGVEELLVGGEVYTRVVPAVGPADPGRLPPPPAVVLGVLARISPTLRARTRAAARILSTNMTDRWIADWVQRDRDAVLTRTAALRGVDLASLDDAALTDHLTQLRTLAASGGRTHFRVFVPYFLALHALHVLLEQHLDGWDAAATASLLTGTSPATRAAEDAMADLRAAVVAVQGLADELRERPHDPLGTIAARDEDLAGRVERWLTEHGWRAPNYDAGAPVLAQQPALVTRLLLAAPTAGTDPDGRAAATAVRERLPAASRGPFATRLARARNCHPWREDTVILAGDAVLGLHHRWLLEAGRRLAERGVLGAARDAAHLTGEEVVAALDGTLPPRAAQRHVTRRRGEEAWARANPGPLTIGHQPAPPDLRALPRPLREVNQAALWIVALEYPDLTDERGPDTDGPPAGALLSGIGASPGNAEGPVRIVRDQGDLAGLHPGDVLVCRVAAPAWVPVFGMCAAVVADGGGALSHAAIAAREHGLPAVLGTRNATTMLTDGQRVRVDGTNGTLHEA